MGSRAPGTASPSQSSGVEQSTDPPVALTKLFSKISELSTLPAIAQRVIEVANSPDSEVEDLRKVIQTDPSLVVRILRRVNSSHYGLRHKVVDLRAGLNLLGFREIRNLALGVFVSQLFRMDGDYGTYSRENLWKHAQAVAVSSQMIAKVTGRGQPNEAYVAGLIHDIGYILIDQHLRSHFCEIIDQLDPDTPTPVTERTVVPFDHAELGAFVARRWDLSEAIVDVIQYHHHPDRYEGEHSELLNVVSLANFLCSRAGWSSLGVHNLTSPPDQVYAALQMDRTGLAVVWEELQGMLGAEAFLDEN